jgi:hypothetical protein
MNATTLEVTATRFLGSSGLDVLKGIVVDVEDNAVYVVGYTQGDFPEYQAYGNDAQNVFAARLSLDLEVVWLSILGDTEPTSSMRFGNGIAVDSSIGYAYITGAIQGATIDGLFITLGSHAGNTISTEIDTDGGNTIGYSIAVDLASHSVYRASTVQANTPPIYENTKLQSTCILSEFTSQCACSSPYRSSACENTPCTPTNPCANGGTCEPVDSALFICHCDRDPEYGGKYCTDSTCPSCNAGVCFAPRSTSVATTSPLWTSATSGTGLRTNSHILAGNGLDNLLFAAEIDGSTSFANINADGESTVVWGYLSTTSGTLGTLFTPDLPSATDVTLVDVILASAVLSDFAYFVVLQTSSDSIFLELDVDLQVTTEFQIPLRVTAIDSALFNFILWGTSSVDVYGETNQGGDDSYVVLMSPISGFVSTIPIFSPSGGSDSVRVSTFLWQSQMSYAAGITNGDLGGAHVGLNDIFVVQYSRTQDAIVALGHVGSTGEDVCTSIVLHGTVGTVFVAGYTTGDFPAFGQSSMGVQSALLVTFTDTLQLVDVKVFSGSGSTSSMHAVSLVVDPSWHLLYMAASIVNNTANPSSESAIVYQLNAVTSELLGQTVHYEDPLDLDYTAWAISSWTHSPTIFIKWVCWVMIPSPSLLLNPLSI